MMSLSLNPSTRLAINGMGRIGRTLFRILYQKGLIKNLIAVNEIMAKDNLIYLLKYDSIRGTFPSNIIPTQNGISIDGHEILFLQQQEIKNLPWKNHSIDTVIEATGLFTNSYDATHHLSSGAKRVLLTTFSKDVPTTVIGVNQNSYNATSIISPGDCTINCVAPLAHLIRTNFGIESIHINVIQGYTTRQELLDKPYKGLRRGRAAAHSIIPFDVNIKPVLENIFPDLQDKIESMSTRIPIPCGAMADLSIVMKKSANAQLINSLIEEASRTELKDIVSITFDPIVSSDILNNTHSSTIDGLLTKVTNKHLRLLAWFDNEWGYTNRLFDWLTFLNI
jgi:glyceraldehyde 3-phosphate dehydrogenase